MLNDHFTDDMLLVMCNDSSIMWDVFLDMGREAIADAPAMQQVIDGIWDVKDAPRYALADRLKDYMDWRLDKMRITRELPAPTRRGKPVTEATAKAADSFHQNVVSTLFAIALDKVDWNNIARRILATVAYGTCCR